MNIRTCTLSLLATILLAPAISSPQDHSVWVESMDLSYMTQDWGRPRKARSVDGTPISLHGTHYTHGVGTHARSEMAIDLKRVATQFHAVVGVDDAKSQAGSVTFEVWVDGKRRAITPVLHGSDEPKTLDVDLTNANHMTLVVTDGGDGIDSDHADWADARIDVKPDATVMPTALTLPPAPMPIIHHGDSPVPAIHGPRIVGTTPGRPFEFLIPATGTAPLHYAASRLPRGLTLNAGTGIITGTLAQAGSTRVRVTVTSPRGRATRILTIVAGTHKLALTPPLGWNSWNVWAGAVDSNKVKAAADVMISSGLAAHGFTYVNIDDTWEGPRDANGEITTNKKFPSMKALSDYVHSRGLKLGIYSSPGPTTCAGYPASYQHEQQDADTWSKWGIDYMKYDWCSYGGIERGRTIAGFQKPYIVMRTALDHADRDIVYSLCQYGMGNVWNWGAQIGANTWRTTGDINDSWGSMKGNAFHHDGRYAFGGPGHWNDPDMLVVGRVGWGPSLHDSRLTPDEQLTHISFWCMEACPLLLGCDMGAMTPFLHDLMTNDEVLDVLQDPAGVPGEPRAFTDQYEVWSRPQSDGTTAVALYNLGTEPQKVTANWSDLKLTGSQPVRDLWQQKNLGVFNGSFSATVAAHSTVMVKIGRPKAAE